MNKLKLGTNRKGIAIPTILVPIGEAISTTTTMLPIGTTTTRTTATTTIQPVPHSNTISDYMFYGIYTVKVLVLKRFVPSDLPQLKLTIGQAKW